jgi:hypothetical protein
MQTEAIAILERHGVMALATLRPDGWPQATMVGYVNDDLILYFLISRSSQKFRNLSLDDRVSIAIGAEASDPKAITGLSMSAHVSEVRDEPYRTQFCDRLSARHSGYFDPQRLSFAGSALMRARPDIVTTVDFSKGLGHEDVITVGADQITEMEPARSDNWGPNPQAEQ